MGNGGNSRGGNAESSRLLTDTRTDSQRIYPMVWGRGGGRLEVCADDKVLRHKRRSDLTRRVHPGHGSPNASMLKVPGLELVVWDEQTSIFPMSHKHVDGSQRIYRTWWQAELRCALTPGARGTEDAPVGCMQYAVFVWNMQYALCSMLYAVYWRSQTTAVQNFRAYPSNTSTFLSMSLLQK